MNNKPRKRVKVWHRDKKRCHICGEKVDLSVATLDHLIPISSGGGDNLDNLAIAHRECNLKRGNGGLYI